MKEKFQDFNFKRSSLALIGQANAILAEYMQAGYTVTLRQLYYQFVQRGFLENDQKNYKRLGVVLNDARLAGLIDWSAMEDRTRNLQRHSSWNNAQGILQGAADGFAMDLWRNQTYRIEYWVEKESLINVVQIAGDRYQIPYFACRGNLSQSEAYAAGKRFKRYQHQGYRPLVIHLGDHDPSGVDMTRDNATRLRMFAQLGVQVKRIALNMDQIEEHSLPPNPAKDTDSRIGGYAEMMEDHGYDDPQELPSWELDALSPDQINELLDNATLPLIDVDERQAQFDRQEEERQLLKMVERHRSEVEKHLRMRLGTVGFDAGREHTDPICEEAQQWQQENEQ